MKIDLHCNLPSFSTIPNPALGYLKGFLSTENNLQVRNIYWNLLPPELMDRYTKIVEESNKIFTNVIDEAAITAYIAKYFYEDNLKSTIHSELSNIFESPFFPKTELKKFAQDLKTYIDSSIEEKKMHEVEIAGFTMKTYQWLLNYYVLLKLKQHNPTLKTIIGGIRSLSQGIEYMKTFKEADFAIWGEGEIPLLKLLKQIDDPISYKEIPNLIYRKNDEIISTYQIAPTDLPDINTHPFADHTDYIHFLEKYDANLNVQIPIWGIRSCFWNKCKFCVLNEEFPYRERTPENIVAEIEYQSKKYNIDRFVFVDTNIGRKDRESFNHLLDLLVQSVEQRGRSYSIQGEMMAMRLDRKSIETMNKIAIVHVQLGFEAMTDSLLRKMMKPQSFAHNIQVLKFAEEQNLFVAGLNIIRGITSETIEDVVESTKNLKFLRFLLRKYSLNETILGLYKDSPFFNEVSDEEREKWWNFDRMWSIVKDLHFLSAADKYEFEGFSRGLINSLLWDIFKLLLKHYQSENFSYKWHVHRDGSSEIEEYGNTILDQRYKYILNPIETEMLLFCDTVKSYSEIKEHFPQLDEKQLHEILVPLKNVGLLYYNDDFKHFFISVVSTQYKTIV
jgi:radical SAM superfamily enzyme YgiQ (UPF0313 family)